MKRKAEKKASNYIPLDNWAVILKYPLCDNYTIDKAFLLPYQRTFIIRMVQNGVKDKILKMNIRSIAGKVWTWRN